MWKNKITSWTHMTRGLFQRSVLLNRLQHVAAADTKNEWLKQQALHLCGPTASSGSVLKGIHKTNHKPATTVSSHTTAGCPHSATSAPNSLTGQRIPDGGGDDQSPAVDTKGISKMLLMLKVTDKFWHGTLNDAFRGQTGHNKGWKYDKTVVQRSKAVISCAPPAADSWNHWSSITLTADCVSVCLLLVTHTLSIRNTQERKHESGTKNSAVS